MIDTKSPATSAAAADVAEVSDGTEQSQDVDLQSAATGEGVEDEAAEVAEPPKTADQLHIEKLQNELAESQSKLRQYSAAVDHARREVTASRERLEREHALVLGEHKAKLVQGLLGVADTLDSALNGAGDGGQAFIDGVTIVRNEFQKALADLGLTRFDPTGDLFDPERHNALTMMPVTDKAHDGRIVQAVNAGTMVGDKVLRPATVVVGKYMGDDQAVN